jgi:hypothetical protein
MSESLVVGCDVEETVCMYICLCWNKNETLKGNSLSSYAWKRADDAGVRDPVFFWWRTSRALFDVKCEDGELLFPGDGNVCGRIPGKKTVQSSITSMGFPLLPLRWCFEADNTSTVATKEAEIFRRISWCVLLIPKWLSLLSVMQSVMSLGFAGGQVVCVRETSLSFIKITQSLIY